MGFYHAPSGSTSPWFGAGGRKTGERNDNTGTAQNKKEIISMKITIAGDSIVVTSSKTLADIKKLEKYAPKALALVEKNDDGEKEEIFRVSSTNGTGSINQYGASFGSVTHDDKKLATITMSIPQGVEDAVKYAAEVVGKAGMLLNRVEAQFDGALKSVDDEMQQILDNIKVAE